MDFHNENKNYDEVEGIPISMTQWVRKHRETPTIKKVISEWFHYVYLEYVQICKVL